MPDKYLPYAEKIPGFKMYPHKAMNMINKESELELVTPDTVAQKITREHFVLINPESGEVYNWVCDGHPCVIYTDLPVIDGALLRCRDPEYVEGQFRDTGR